MPIQPNPIIDTFLQAISIKNQQKQQAIENAVKQKELAQNEERIQHEANVIDETKDYHSRQLAQQEAVANFNQAMLKLKQQGELEDQYQKFGTVQPQYKEDTSAAASVPIADGIAATSHTFRSPGLQDPAFTALDPLSASVLAAQKGQIELGPKADLEKALKDLEVKGKMKEIEYQQNAEDQRSKLLRETQRQNNINNNNTKLEVERLKGKNDKSLTASREISNQFENDPSTKRYTLVKEATDYADQFDQKFLNPPKGYAKETAEGVDDNALIKAYIKVLNPAAMSRSGGPGESELVRDNAQSLAERFGVAADRIINGTAVLSDKARQSIINTIRDKATPVQNEYKNLRDSTMRKVKAAGGDADIWITDHSKTSAIDLSQFDHR